MRKSPIGTGAIAEAKVMARLLEAGHTVSLPFGSGCCYDLVWDDGVSLRRVQCKSGRIRGTALTFKTQSQQGAKNGKRARLGYAGRADVFGVYCPSTGLVYIVPVADAPGAECHLRIAPARNAQEKGIRWARDFVLDVAVPEEG